MFRLVLLVSVCARTLNRSNAITMAITCVYIVLLIILINLVLCSAKLNTNEEKTWKNQNFRAFRGIRYAEAPTGALRFKVDPFFDDFIRKNPRIIWICIKKTEHPFKKYIKNVIIMICCSLSGSSSSEFLE